jgi:predicted exporter
VTRRSWVTFLTWCLVLGLGAWFAATRVHVETELSRLLPEGATPTERLLLTELRTGTTGRLILMALEGEDADVLAGTSKQLAAWMRKSGAFQYIGNGGQAWTKEERERLFQHRYLLSPNVQASTFSRDHLRHSLELRLSDLASPLSPMVKELIPADPTGEFTKILQTWMIGTAPTRHLGVWFSSDLRRALLLAETHAAGFDLESQEHLQGQIREAFRRITGEPTGAPPVHLVMTGPSVIAVEMQQTIQADVWRLSLCATLLVTTFLLVSYGSATILTLSLLPLASAIVAGIVAVDLAFGFVHGITLAFGITLLGVVDDYPIHLFSHLTNERWAPAVMKEIWPTMRLGVVATALGFSALLLSGFPGLSQLGLFAIVGLFTAACVTRWVLPHIVPRGFQARRDGLQVARWIDALTTARFAVPVLVILAVGSFTWSDTPLWEQDIANLSPISTEKKERDQALRDELRVPDVRDLIVAEGSSEEEVLQRSETMAPALDTFMEKGELAGYDLAARYLPSRKTQQARQAALPDRETLERNLTSAVKGLPFKPSLFQPFLDAAGKAKTQEPVDSRTFRGTALGLKLDSLLFMREGHWIAAVPLRGVTDRQKFRELLTPWHERQVTYLDLKDESNRMVSAYRNESLRLLGWGILSIGLVLFAGLRAPVTVLRVMLPIGSAVVVVAALLHTLGERFSLFHLASFLLVIGLGLDYALFFNRRHGTPAVRGRTVYGLVVCSTTTILVFGVLAFSQIPVLRAIGMTAALGSLACLVFAAFLAEPPEKPTLLAPTSPR